MITVSAARKEHPREPLTHRDWYMESKIVPLHDHEQTSMKSSFKSHGGSVRTEPTVSVSSVSVLKCTDTLPNANTKCGRMRNGTAASPPPTILQSIEIVKNDHQPQGCQHTTTGAHQSCQHELEEVTTSMEVMDEENHAVNGTDGNGPPSKSSAGSSSMASSQQTLRKGNLVNGYKRGSASSSLAEPSQSEPISAVPPIPERSFSGPLSPRLLDTKRSTLLTKNGSGCWSDDPSAVTGTSNMGDDSSRRLLSRRTVSAVDLVFSNHGGDRDLCPRAPRRRSFNRSESNPSTGTSVGGNSRANDATGNDLKSQIMARIPEHVLKQLPKEQWERIFSVLTTKGHHASGFNPAPKSPLREAVREAKAINKEVDDEDLSVASSVVSALTNPISLWQPERDDPSTDVKSADTLPTRSWHGGTPKNEGAPRIPSRGSVGELRRFSNPVFATKVVDSRKPTLRRHFSTPMESTIKDPSRKVQFAKVFVRYHERILDVNPSTSSGPSLGLGWKYEDEPEPLDLQLHLSDRVTNSHGIVMSRTTREEILGDLGYYRSDIAKAVRLNLKLKNQRAQTYNNLKHQKVEYLFEQSKRKVGKLLRFRPARRHRSIEITDEWSSTDSKHSRSS